MTNTCRVNDYVIIVMPTSFMTLTHAVAFLNDLGWNIVKESEYCQRVGILGKKQEQQEQRQQKVAENQLKKSLLNK